MDAIIRAASVAGTHVLRRPQDRKAHAAELAQAAIESAGSPVQAPMPAAPAATPMPAPDPIAELETALAEQVALCTSQAARIERLLLEHQRAEAHAQAREQQLGAELAQLKEHVAKLEQEQGAAFDGAVRRGFADGEERGAAAAKDLVREQVERFAAITAQVSQSKLAMLADAEDMIVEIAFTALCRMLGETAAARETVAAMVKRLVHGERELELLTVHLHPQDLDCLNATAADDAVRVDPRVRLQADGAIALGGCMVEGPRGTLDARLDMQLQRLREALLAVRNERRDAGESV